MNGYMKYEEIVTFTRQFNIATYKIKSMTSDTGVEFTKLLKGELYQINLMSNSFKVTANWKYHTQELECRLGEETELATWYGRSQVMYHFIQWALLKYKYPDYWDRYNKFLSAATAESKLKESKKGEVIPPPDMQ